MIIIIQNLFGENHQNSIDAGPAIQWLSEPEFSIASITLPCYEDHRDELDEGFTMPGELEPVLFPSLINILVCQNNYGYFDINELNEVASEHEQNPTNLVNIYDTRVFFRSTIEEPEHLEDEQNRMEYSISQDNIPDRPTFLVLYLNQYVFESNNEDERATLISTIQSCIDDPNINLVLLHEQDVLKGGCEFDLFYEEGPQELINPPYDLLTQAPVKLYSSPEYRSVSLRLLLCEMGGSPK